MRFEKSKKCVFSLPAGLLDEDIVVRVIEAAPILGWQTHEQGLTLKNKNAVFSVLLIPKNTFSQNLNRIRRSVN